MTEINTLPIHKSDDGISPLISAFIIVMFLFFIDEGYYDFRWMADWGNWIVFVVYMIIFFPLQWLVSYFILSGVSRWKKIAMMVGLSVPVSLFIFSIVF